MKEKIESPFIDGFAYLNKELRTRTFRKENFQLWEHFYVCEITKEEFTTTEIGDYNLNQVYNQYREKYGFPFPDQIMEMRTGYGLNAIQMSKILGLGVNMVRNYETGEMPSTSNAVLLNFASEPEYFRKHFLKRYLTCGISERKKKEILKNIDKLLAPQHPEDCTPRGGNPSQFTGYRKPDFERLSNMLIYFLQKDNCLLKMRLNKCLFYADFSNFKYTGRSISGMQYQTLNNHPVALRHLHVFAAMVDQGYLKITLHSSKEFKQEIEKLNPAKPFDESIFSSEEIHALDVALETVVKSDTKNQPWEVEANNSPISYQKYAYSL